MKELRVGFKADMTVAIPYEALTPEPSEDESPIEEGGSLANKGKGTNRTKNDLRHREKQRKDAIRERSNNPLLNKLMQKF